MRFTSSVIFYGLADHSVRRVIDFFSSREDAEDTLKQVLQDEPGWASMLEVVAVEFGSAPLTAGRTESHQ